MRKPVILMLILSLVLFSLAACSNKDNVIVDSSKVPTQAPQVSNDKKDPMTQVPAGEQMDEPTPTPESTPTPEPTPTVAPTPANETGDADMSIDKSVKEFKYVSGSYTITDTNMGTIEQVEYKTYTYDSKNQELTKTMNVYLPYGYNPDDKETKYNVFYLMHGGGENQNTIFGGPGKNTELMRIIDNMIKNGDIEPLIIVTPTFYNQGNSNASQLTRDFHNELVNDIIPAVEGKYNTYAASTSQEDLKAARSHRAFGGFSMGSACTWYVYINCLDYFEYFMPLSGDCWVLGDAAGRSKAKETARFLAKVAEDSGYATDEYYIFCATGTNDVAYDNMVPQIDAMKELSDRFIYTADFTQGNFYFMVAKYGTHTWNYVNQYIFNILPYFFFK